MRRVPKPATLARFWQTTESGCWVWSGHVDSSGYGRYGYWLAHRVVYLALVGPIPSGLELDHVCKKTICVNPDHMEPVTRAENIRRRYASQTHCKRGHEFTEENTYRLAGRGPRQCRVCQAASVRAYKMRQRAAS